MAGARAPTPKPPVTGPAVGPTRVSNLELFFDLVFVFTITQLTSVLEAHPTPRGLLQVTLMLAAIWWMYDGYAWLTNTVAPDRLGRRLLLLASMACYLVLALAIPHAFSGSGTAFGLAYLAVVLVHAALFTRASSQSVVRAIIGLAPFNLGTALLVLAAGIAGGTLEYVLLGAAVAIEWTSPYLLSHTGFEIGTEHFVERHGLVVLIAIGESVVAVGHGRARASRRPRARRRRGRGPRALGLPLVDVLRRGRRDASSARCASRRPSSASSAPCRRSATATS